jgi:hypothetical protein
MPIHHAAGFKITAVKARGAEVVLFAIAIPDAGAHAQNLKPLV